MVPSIPLVGAQIVSDGAHIFETSKLVKLLNSANINNNY